MRPCFACWSSCRIEKRYTATYDCYAYRVCCRDCGKAGAFVFSRDLAIAAWNYLADMED